MYDASSSSSSNRESSILEFFFLEKKGKGKNVGEEEKNPVRLLLFGIYEKNQSHNKNERKEECVVDWNEWDDAFIRRTEKKVVDKREKQNNNNPMTTTTNITMIVNLKK